MKKMIIGLVLGMMIGSATVAAAAPGTVQAVLAKLSFYVDGQSKNLKAAPLVYNGTTYLPVREVSGLLGYDLDFNSKAAKINFKSKGDSDVTTTPTTTEWIALRTLADTYNLSVGQTGDSNGTFRVKNDTNVWFDLPVLKDGSDTVVISSNGQEIHVKYTNKGIQVNKKDLQNSGLINQ